MADKDRTSYSGIFLLLAMGGILVAVALPGIIEEQFKYYPKQSVKGDLVDIAVALETYYIDNSCYPPAVDATGKWVIKSASGEPYTSGYVSWILTTPIAYLRGVPRDRFGPPRPLNWSRGYRYAATYPGYWILVSRGPDEDFDMIAEDYILSASGDITRYVSHFGPGKAVEYDPTNGTQSSGDIFRTGP